MIDKGKGIERQDLDKLFQYFGKLESSANENKEGVGLGLAICQ